MDKGRIERPTKSVWDNTNSDDPEELKNFILNTVLQAGFIAMMRLDYGLTEKEILQIEKLVSKRTTANLFTLVLDENMHEMIDHYRENYEIFVANVKNHLTDDEKFDRILK